jgi:uncharacterized protein
MDWHDVLESPGKIPFKGQLADDLITELQRSLLALRERDIRYLTGKLVTRDHWRILGYFFDKATFFDIETSGLGWNDYITIIVCYHRGKIHYFVENENLDSFLDLLHEVDLLVSFNGSTFDVPRVLDAFHIPELPCPHIDLRWLCYHAQYKGGLKAIAEEMGFVRPEDLGTLDGADAVLLWDRWTNRGDFQAKSLLIRYCCTDVLLLVLVAIRALEEKGHRLDPLAPESLWKLIPSI